MTRAKPKDWLSVGLCVNDERGTDVHRIRALEVTDARGNLFELESPYVHEDASCLRNPVCFGLSGRDPQELVRLRVGHCVLAAKNHTPHVGNICWDNVQMSRAEVRRLFKYLLGTRGWSLTGGLTTSDLYPGGTFALANEQATAARSA